MREMRQSNNLCKYTKRKLFNNENYSIPWKILDKKKEFLEIKRAKCSLTL